MIFTKTRVLLAFAISLSVFLAGCGGGGGSDSSAPVASTTPPEEPALEPEARSYSLSLIAIEAQDKNTGQSISVQSLPLAGNTAVID